MDNIATDESFKLYEAWYQQNFLEDRLSFLAGLHDYNSEFDALNFAGNLINSSFGISPDISQVGPSIFATTSLAARVRYSTEDLVYVQGAIYDGVPGDPENPRGTHVDLHSGDGAFYGFETGYAGEDGPDYWKAAVGAWYHTAEFEDFAGNARDHNGGFYLIAEKRLTQEEDAAQGLGAFFQLGRTSAARNPFATYVGGGVQYTGAIESRDEDAVSFGFAYARNGSEFRNSDPDFTRGELALELNYRAVVLPWFALTGDLQYIVDPGTSRSVDDATVLGVRAELAM